MSEEDRQGAVGLLMGVTFTGQGLSAGLGGLICDLVGWRAAFICFGALGTAAWLGVRRLRYLDETDGAGTVDAAGAGVSVAGAGAGGSAEREPFRPAAFLRHAAQILFGPGRAVYFVAFTTGIIFLGVYGFMGAFLAERCGLSSTQAGLLMMFYGLACLAGGSISGRIGEARGQRGVIAVGETSGVIATALLAASTITGSWMPALPAAACLGLGYILVQPTLVSFSMDIDPSHTGLCTGLIAPGSFRGRRRWQQPRQHCHCRRRLPCALDNRRRGACRPGHRRREGSCRGNKARRQRRSSANGKVSQSVPAPSACARVRTIVRWISCQKGQPTRRAMLSC